MRKPFFILIPALLVIAWISQDFRKGYGIVPPKTWDSLKIHQFLLPLADRSISIRPISESYYYQLPEIKIYKSYPIFLTEDKDTLYVDSLKKLDPVEIFKPENIKTQEDLIRYGEYVFNAPILSLSMPVGFLRELKDLVKKAGIPIGKNNLYPFSTYVVETKGTIKIGIFSCAMCHSRVMPDSSIIKGAQGNFPMDRRDAYRGEENISTALPLEIKQFDTSVRNDQKSLQSAPWIHDVTEKELDTITAKTTIAYLKAIPPGVLLRHGSKFKYPTNIPDLIGIKDRKYLDFTGIMRQQSIGDLMRYAAFNQTLDMLNDYNGFIPNGTDFSKLPNPGEATFIGTFRRYSDMELFALANYLYSLVPPPNPNHFDSKTLELGSLVFKREGCVTCHTPPLYTNNKLTPVTGFTPQKTDYANLDIFDASVETDPGLALYTRRGTGYYKIPSLKGVWYRGPFGHSGNAASLEEWFDKNRLNNDYKPLGYKPASEKSMPISGHEFGLDISEEDKKALISFLRTL